MTKKLSRRNRPLKEYSELTSSPGEEVRVYSNPVEPFIVAIEEEDSDGGEVGTADLSVDVNEARNEAFNENRRRYDGQGKFATGSFVKKTSSSSCGLGEKMQMHPLLSQSSQFSGIDPALNPNPAENPEAYEQFIQKRLEYQRQLKKNLGLGASKNIAPSR